MLEFKPASRKACPQLIMLASVTGGGKTFSALLLARGLAGPKGRVAFIDTENGRGEMYASNLAVEAAILFWPASRTTARIVYLPGVTPKVITALIPVACMLANLDER